MAKRRILLLGASGYLGTQIYDHFMQDKSSQIAGTCFSASHRDDFFQIDVTNEHHLLKLLQDVSPDVVIWSLMSETNEQTLMEKGLGNLLDLLPEQTKLLFISTDGIFGQGTGHFSEEDQSVPLDDKNPLSVYTNAKIWGEAQIKARHDNHMILRIGPIYGKNSKGIWDKRVSTLMKEIGSGKEVVKPANLYKTFIHVEDLANAIHEIATSSLTGTLHLGPLQKESYYSFHQKMAHFLGSDPRLIKEITISEQEALKRGIPLDTSLNTTKSARLLQTQFRNIGE